MTPTEKTTKRASERTSGAGNDIFSRAQEAAEQLQQMGTIVKERKYEISIIIDELIKIAKAQTPPTTATQSEKATQTEPTITTIMFDQSDLKAIDKKMDHVITILTKESRKAWPQITPMATPPATPQQPAAMKNHIHKARKERSQYEITRTTSNAPTPTC